MTAYFPGLGTGTSINTSIKGAPSDHIWMSIFKLENRLTKTQQLCIVSFRMSRMYLFRFRCIFWVNQRAFFQSEIYFQSVVRYTYTYN
jgi:hypothetical protein